VIDLSDDYEINIITIKFIKVSTNHHIKTNNSDLFRLLKLCLLKEIFSKFDLYRVEKLPDIICYMIQVLQLVI